jgi:hypothetical protein
MKKRFLLIPFAFLLLGAVWIGENLQPGTAGNGEIGDIAKPFGSGNFVIMDAGTVNTNSLSISAGSAITGSFGGATSATAAPATIGCTSATATCTGAVAGNPVFCSPAATPQTGNATEVVTIDAFASADTCNVQICCASATCTAPPSVIYKCREVNQ